MGGQLRADRQQEVRRSFGCKNACDGTGERLANSRVGSCTRHVSTSVMNLSDSSRGIPTLETSNFLPY